jgi:NADP-reducing hydrogenase subunit HndB
MVLKKLWRCFEMKTLKELEEIKQRTLDSVNLRKDRSGGTRVVVGMATCGIAAGARPVLLSFLEEVKKRNLGDVTVPRQVALAYAVLNPW